MTVTQAVTEAAGGSVLTDADPLAVVALTECVINGVRRQKRERFNIRRGQEHTLVGHGLLESDASFARLWDRASGRILTPDAVPTTYAAGTPGPTPLRVLQLTHYDPGCAAYRYHSALNTQDGVQSAFVRFGHSNAACDLRQWDGYTDTAQVMALVVSADVIVCHMDYRCLFNDIREAPAASQVLVRHYHGSMLPVAYGGDPAKQTYVEDETDRKVNAVQVGARPYHHRWGVPHWWGIPMPVADYARLAARRAPRAGRPLRVAHSPTVRKIKGTEAFLDAVAALRAEGVAIEPVLIEGMDHGEALRVKATCDVTFDSFWLGMQGSGLEMAAMGGAVIAGDVDAVRDLVPYGEAEVTADGRVVRSPWTFADDGATLKAVFRRMAEDEAWRLQEAARVAGYVHRWHAYEVVGARALQTLTDARVARGFEPRGMP